MVCAHVCICMYNIGNNIAVICSYNFFLKLKKRRKFKYNNSTNSIINLLKMISSLSSICFEFLLSKICFSF